MKSILKLQAGLPGIVALFAFSPETAKPMSQLAEQLLRSENSLSRGERELIAAVVSRHNNTRFCYKSHRAFATLNLLKEQKNINLDAVFQHGVSAIQDQRLRMLCRIALRTADNNDKEVYELASLVIGNGLVTQKEVHDAVLIAAAFCMYNRYVKCLQAPLPVEEVYAENAEVICEMGYCAHPEEFASVDEVASQEA